MANGGSMVLDLLVTAFDRGRLVPFIGGGMSAGACQLWEPFVDALEVAAELPPTKGDPVQRAARAVWRLRSGQGKSLAEAVKVALPCKQPAAAIPPQTTALAQLHLPIVVSTNYDDLYVAAALREHLARFPDDKKARDKVPLLLLGRSPRDCQRVLAALRQPEIPILWALQGFAGGQALVQRGREDADGAAVRERSTICDCDYARRSIALGAELVVGHAEYRRVTVSSEPFRRAFAELHRSRSLLFLGSGLKEHYFQALFSEIIELYGSGAYPHFAVLQAGEADEEFLRREFGIWTYAVDDHGELPVLLRRLRPDASSRGRQLRWRFGEDRLAPGGLEFVRGAMPVRHEDRECLAFSAGGPDADALADCDATPTFRLSPVGKAALEALSLSPKAFKPVRSGDRTCYVWSHRDDPAVFAVVARADPSSDMGARVRPTEPRKAPIGGESSKPAGGRARRDVRLIPPAVVALMRAVEEAGYAHAHSMLLSAGALRTFPPSQTALQMARGWARWRNEAGRDAPELSVYVDDPDVLHDLDSGRLDLARALTPDAMEFWLEIVSSDGTVLRRVLAVERAGLGLSELMRGLDITGLDWKLDVEPAPSSRWTEWTLGDVETWEARYGPEEMSLERFGVLPGSTLRATEPGRRGAERAPPPAAVSGRGSRG